MSQKFIIAGVGTLDLYDPSSAELIVNSKTLTESGINFTLTAEDIRGGMANALIGQYFHDSGMGLTLTDCLFSMEYLALNVGGEISVGSDAFTTESITTTVANKITVSATPQAFGNVGTVGWYTIAGKNNWKVITFEGTEATVADLTAGSEVCVRYLKNDASAEQFTVSSAFIPSQCTAVLTLPLFKAGTETTTSYTSSSKVGEVQITIPNFILSGAQDLSLSSGGASTTSLSGNALVSFDGTEGCSGDGYYAKLVQITYNKDEFGDVKNIVIADSNIELAVDDTQTLQVWALYGGIKKPRLIENTKLTFTSKNDTVATVSTAGIVTAVGAGSTTIEVVVTDANHSDLVATAYVEVTA